MAKQVIRQELFTGYKSARLEDLPEEAWQILTGEGAGGKLRDLYEHVAWLRQCIHVRAAAVANMPYEITQGERVIATDDEPAPGSDTWINDIPDLLYRTETALMLDGRAYWFKHRNPVKTLSARWVTARSIEPVLDSDKGLVGFKRHIGNETKPLEVDDLVYFWLPDDAVEIGPPKSYPGKAAQSAAAVLAALDDFTEGYFERGMIKATILQYDQSLNTDEAKEIKAWWMKVATGVKNAFATLLLRGDFKTVVVGEGVGDLQNSALTAEKREDICTALGVPQSKVTANAANYATKQSDDQMFIQDTVAPQCKWLASVINDQLLGPMGYRLTFKPEQLPVMQEDEKERSGALLNLVNAGMPLPVALEVLGYDLPQDMSIETVAPVQAALPAPAEVPMLPDGRKSEELDRLRRFIANGTHHKRAFTSDILTPDEIETELQLAALQEAQKATAMADSYADESAALVLAWMDGDINLDQMTTAWRRLAAKSYTAAFMRGAGVQFETDLTAVAMSKLNQAIDREYEAIDRAVAEMVAAVQAEGD